MHYHLYQWLFHNLASRDDNCILVSRRNCYRYALRAPDVLESAIYLVARTRQLRSNIWCLLVDERARPPVRTFGHVSSISYNVMHMCILDVVVYIIILSYLR
jgi:hypothetical protein